MQKGHRQENGDVVLGETYNGIQNFTSLERASEIQMVAGNEATVLFINESYQSLIFKIIKSKSVLEDNFHCRINWVGRWDHVHLSA